MTKVAFIGVEPGEKKFFSDRLAEKFELQFIREVDWQSIDPATEAISVFVNFDVTADVMNALPNLKLITCRSTGYNNVNMEEAKRRGIMVANTPGYGASSVAEFVFVLILMLSRKINVVRRETAENDDKVDRIAERGWDLNGRMIGVVGLGAIGRGVAKIAHGFGMKIMAYDIHNDLEFAKLYDIQLVDDMEKICRESDIVTLHIPYKPENYHFLSAKLLAQMKDTALVINTSRGEMLNTLQLARMLQEGKLGGAGLDVIEDESYLTDPSAIIELAAHGNDKAIDKLKHALAMLLLERMPNAIITNHNAYNTVEAMELINNMTVDNIVNFYNDPSKVFVVE